MLTLFWNAVQFSRARPIKNHVYICIRVWIYDETDASHKCVEKVHWPFLCVVNF